MTDSGAQRQSKRSEQTGVVVSTGGDQTCTVVIDRLVRHPIYGKYLHRRTRLAVHDPANQAALGDTISLTPCRPISKRKRWRLLGVLKRATLAQHEALTKAAQPSEDSVRP